MLNLRARLAKDDAGFTLPELLITIVISGLIAGSVGATIVVALRLMEQSKGTLGDTGNTIFASAYFSTDVQEATTVVFAGDPSCGTGTLLVEFRGDDFGAPPVYPTTAATAYKTYVSYVTEAVPSESGPPTILLKRQACWQPGAATSPFEPDVESTLATQLSSTTPPEVLCYQATLNQPVDPCVPNARMIEMNLRHSTSGDDFQLIGTRRTQ